MSENLFILCSSDWFYGSTTLVEVANYGQSENVFPRRVLLGVLCEGVLPLPPNADRYIRLKMSFCTPVFRPGL